jgi:hypothetical protein
MATVSKKEQYKFSGEWLPEYDAAEIGPESYRELTNMRYGSGHPEGILGYTKINTTALTTYTHILSGYQLRTPGRTQETYTLVHASNSAGTASRVFVNKTAIPSQGDFEGTAVHTDASGATLGRFSKAPNGNVTYANGEETCVWAGNEMPVGAFFTIDDAAYANPEERTHAANNTRQTDNDIISIGSQKFWIVLTRRPIQAVKYYIKTANATAGAVTTGKVWNGSAFAAVSNPSDGTISGGISLAQTGIFSFDSTVGTAKPFHFGGYYAYAYLFEIDLGTAEIYHVTVDAPWQDMVDIWDGVDRQPIVFEIYNGSEFEDYSSHVINASDSSNPIGAVFDGLTTSAYAVIMFEERMSAINLAMLVGLVNTNASALTVAYWDGSSYQSVTDTDGTDNGGDTLGKSGLISWNPPDPEDEVAQTMHNETGYAYKLTWSATLSGTPGGDAEVVVDTCTGIPAQLPLEPCKFTSMFKGRTLRCNFTKSIEGNRVDYGPVNTVNTFNGLESSQNGDYSLFFGGSDELTCGTQLYNRYGSNVFEVWVGFKSAETYQLKGNGREDFEWDTVSENIGCPAPMTLATAEIGFQVSEGAKRNIVIWLSHSGPYAYDGAVLYPIPGISNYFDPASSTCIDLDSISDSRGWYDTVYHEYNLVLPGDIWLVYDLIKRRWYKKNTGSAKTPTAAIPVLDSNGRQYVYGGLDNGYVMRLENGTSWDGAGIEQVVWPGDFWPSGSVWDKTDIFRLKVIAKRISADYNLDIDWFSDTISTSGTGYTFVSSGEDYVFADSDDYEYSSPSLTGLSLSSDNSGGERLARDTARMSLRAWAHSFRFSVTTDDIQKAFEPIGWAIEYNIMHDDC